MEDSSRNHRRTEKIREARVMDDMYALNVDWTTPVMVTVLVMVGLGFWSCLLWWSFRNT